MKKTVLAALIGAAFIGTALAASPVLAVQDITVEHLKDNAEADAEEIIQLRSSLAKVFVKPGAEVTEDTFKEVCGAVAKRVKEISDKEGVTIRHAAVKYRNPRNAATPEEAKLIERFESDRNLKEVWGEGEKDGKKTIVYTRPIFVDDACLACHGEKDSRPRFITNKYPSDLAYGFKRGDLRGIIIVTTPVE